MPKLISLYIRNVAIGFGLAAVFVGLLLALNVQNLWHLVTHSSSGPLAVFLLWFMNGIVFAGVQFAWAVMNLARRDTPGQGGTPVSGALRPATVPARTRTDTQPLRGPGA